MSRKPALVTFRKTSFKITLDVTDGVLSIVYEGDVSYWDEIGVAEAYRALLRIKVLHDYRWPNAVKTEGKPEQ